MELDADFLTDTFGEDPDRNWDVESISSSLSQYTDNTHASRQTTVARGSSVGGSTVRSGRQGGARKVKVKSGKKIRAGHPKEEGHLVGLLEAMFLREAVVQGHGELLEMLCAPLVLLPASDAAADADAALAERGLQAAAALQASLDALLRVQDASAAEIRKQPLVSLQLLHLMDAAADASAVLPAQDGGKDDAKPKDAPPPPALPRGGSWKWAVLRPPESLKLRATMQPASAEAVPRAADALA